MEDKNLTNLAHRVCKKAEGLSEFHIELGDNLREWTVTLQYGEQQCHLHLTFTDGSANLPTVKIMRPRVTGDSIHQGVLCLQEGVVSLTPETLLAFLHTIHNHLSPSHVKYSEGSYTGEEHATGMRHIASQHPNQVTNPATLAQFYEECAGDAAVVGDTHQTAGFYLCSLAISPTDARRELSRAACASIGALAYAGEEVTVEGTRHIVDTSDLETVVRGARDGDTIVLSGGDYVLRSPIVPSITIESESPSVIFVASLSVYGKDVTIRNVRIHGSSGLSVVRVFMGNLKMKGCSVTGGVRGIHCEGGSVTLSECEVVDMAQGVLVDQVFTPTSCTISHSFLSASEFAVEATKGELTVEGCRIENKPTTPPKYSFGIIVLEASLTVTDTSVTGFNNGVTVNKQGSAVIRGLEALDTKQAGVISKGGKVVLEDSFILRGKIGIEAVNEATFECRRVLVSEMANEGVTAHTGSRVVLRNSTISATTDKLGTSGVSAVAACIEAVDGCRLSGTYFSASALSGGRLLLEGIWIEHCNNAVTVDNSETTIRDAHITNARRVGVYVCNNGKATVEESSILGGDHGLEVNQGQLIAKGVSLRGCNERGVFASCGGTAVLTDCVASVGLKAEGVAAVDARVEVNGGHFTGTVGAICKNAQGVFRNATFSHCSAAGISSIVDSVVELEGVSVLCCERGIIVDSGKGVVRGGGMGGGLNGVEVGGDVSLTDLVVKGYTQSGVVAKRQGKAVVTDCLVSGGDKGLMAQETGELHLFGGTVSSRFAIGAISGGHLVCCGTKVSLCTNAFTVDASTAKLKEVVVTHASQVGIIVTQQGAMASVTDSAFLGRMQYGLEVRMGGRLEASNLTVQGVLGVYAYTGGTVQLTRCLIKAREAMRSDDECAIAVTE